MTTLNEIITDNEKQTRRNAIAFAQANNYKVSEMYAESKDEWFKLMTEIHQNGKKGNYSLAKQYLTVVETLETWN